MASIPLPVREAPSAITGSTIVLPPQTQYISLSLPSIPQGPLPAPLSPPPEYEAAVINVPEMGPYPTLSLSQVSFLHGESPNNEDAYNWEWEPVTQKFVNKSARRWMSKQEFLAIFYPEKAVLDKCKKVNIEELHLGTGMPVPFAIKDGQVAVVIYLKDMNGNIVIKKQLLFRDYADREAMMQSLQFEIMDKLGFIPENFRLIIYHPRMYDFSNAKPLAAAFGTDMYGEYTIAEALSTFPGLGETNNQFVIPIELIPASRHEKRQIRDTLSEQYRKATAEKFPAQEFYEVPRRERLNILASLVSERKDLVNELQKRSGRNPEELQAEWSAAIQAKTQQLLKKKIPAIPSNDPQRQRARNILLSVLEQLFKAINEGLKVNVQQINELTEWLINSILSGPNVENVDYALEFSVIRRMILNGEMPEKDTRAWLYFLRQVDQMIDEASEIEAYSARTRDRVPIFDPKSGEVIDYEDELTTENYDPYALEIIKLAPHEHAHSDIVNYPRIQCHKCKKWRTLQAGFTRPDYNILQIGPEGELIRRDNCIEFGFIFQYTISRIEQYVPMNSEYIIAYTPSVEMQTSVPRDLIKSDGSIQGFGLTEVIYDETGESKLYDSEFIMDPSKIYTLDPKTTAIYSLPPRNPINNKKGIVFIFDPNNPSDFQPVPDGVAIAYYCRLPNGEIVTIPLNALQSFSENLWECGDPGMDPHSAAVRQMLTRLRELEALYSQQIVSKLEEEELLHQIQKLRNQLHAEAQETANEIENRMQQQNPNLFVTNESQEYLNILDNMDKIAEKRWQAVSKWIEEAGDEATESPSDEEVGEENLRQKLRKKRTIDVNDIETIEEDIATRKKNKLSTSAAITPEILISAETPEQSLIKDQIDKLLDYLQDQYLNKHEAEANLKSFLETNIHQLDQPDIQAETQIYENEIQRIKEQIEQLLLEIASLRLSMTSPTTNKQTNGYSANSKSEVDKPSIFKRAVKQMRNFPNGIHYKELAALVWVDEGKKQQDIVDESTDFLRFAKTLNSTLSEPRNNNPVFKLNGWPTSKGSGMGLYILKDFVTPETIPSIVDTITDYAQAKNIKKYDREYLNETLNKRFEIQRKLFSDQKDKQYFLTDNKLSNLNSSSDTLSYSPQSARKSQSLVMPLMQTLSSALNTQMPIGVPPAFNASTMQHLESLITQAQIPMDNMPIIMKQIIQPYISTYMKARSLPITATSLTTPDIFDSVARQTISQFLQPTNTYNNTIDIFG